MSSPGTSKLVTALLLVILAGSLRFYKLGNWPFAGDETATLAEERSLFASEGTSRDSQTYRLPRIIPLSYLFLHVGNSLFGRDEFGSRVMLAILGTLNVGLVFLMLDALRGAPRQLRPHCWWPSGRRTFSRASRPDSTSWRPFSPACACSSARSSLSAGLPCSV